jgi:hypothetical protein
MWHCDVEDVVEQMGVRVGSPCEAVTYVGGNFQTDVKVPIVSILAKNRSGKAVFMEEVCKRWTSIEEIVWTSILGASNLVEEKEVGRPFKT